MVLSTFWQIQLQQFPVVAITGSPSGSPHNSNALAPRGMWLEHPSPIPSTWSTMTTAAVLLYPVNNVQRVTAGIYHLNTPTHLTDKPKGPWTYASRSSSSSSRHPSVSGDDGLRPVWLWSHQSCWEQRRVWLSSPILAWQSLPQLTHT